MYSLIGTESNPFDGTEAVTDMLIVSRTIANQLTDSDADHPYVDSGTVVSPYEAAEDPLTVLDSDLRVNSKAAMDLLTDIVPALVSNTKSGAGRVNDLGTADNTRTDSVINITPLTDAECNSCTKSGTADSLVASKASQDPFTEADLLTGTETADDPWASGERVLSM